MAPEDEDKEPEEQVDLQEIIDYYTGKVGLEEAPEESSPEPAPLPSAKEALKALSIVQAFTESQDAATTEDVKALDRLERSINLLSIKARKQGTLDAYFGLK